jgi:hypothetical protein
MRKATLVVVGLALALVACTADLYKNPGGLPGSDTENGSDAQQSTSGTQPASGTGGGSTTKSCSAASSQAIAGADPSGFPVCTGTKGTSGRCVPTSALGRFSDQFEQAGCSSGQACVPDELVKDGSNVQLTKCTGVVNTEGRCFWPLQKDIIANYDLLKEATKDQCTNGMVCAPCVNPLTNQDTGLCSLGGAAGGGQDGCASATTTNGGGAPATPAPAPGPAGVTCPQVAPIVDVSGFQAEDCGSGMLCIPANLVPADEAKMLKDCSKGKCAPTKVVERAGNYVAKTCTSVADSEGRCIAAAIPEIAAQASFLPQADCDADERCAPCFDPRTGADTGACHMAPCDAPKQPKTILAACCNGRGTCVPSSMVDSTSATFLQAASCSGGTPLCAPNELVGSATPKKCTAAFGLIDGICVSKCTMNGLVANLVQGNCSDDEMCAPCDVLPSGSCN